MNVPSLPYAISLCLDRGVPFYACRIPGSTYVQFGAQVDGNPCAEVSISSYIFKEGFVVHPFDATCCPAAFIEKQLSLDSSSGWERVYERPSRPLPSLPLHDISRDEYFSCADVIIKSLQHGNVRKVVLSRVFPVQASTAECVPEWFDRLLATYTSAFVFLVYIPGSTVWMGASPELFLHCDNESISTYSLAATKPLDDTTPWSEKEFEEQQIVTDYIEHVIAHSMGKKPILSSRYERYAGKMKHLCTTLSLPAPYRVDMLDSLLSDLHPTPAVGGFPRNEAVKLISEVETHSRRYYAGYVGFSSGKGCCDLYVNLRSMELLTDRVDIYVGGGLTARSIIADEWRETCIKTSTMLDIIIPQKQ